MNVGEEQELRLQRASATLIAELKRFLPALLFSHGTPSHGARKCVKWSNVERIIKLVGQFLLHRLPDSLPILIRIVSQLEPFQGWPQLLDPHLAMLMDYLVSAFRSYLSYDTEKYTTAATQDSESVPLPRGISRIIYILCKVRGQKVISRLLGNEPFYLGLILNKLQQWQGKSQNSSDLDISNRPSMIWEERYVMLLWLAHLMMAPFGLDSISHESRENLDATQKVPKSVRKGLPPIAIDLLQTALGVLDAPSRERETASLLLTRLALRPDMQKYDLAGNMIRWVVEELGSEEQCDANPYHYTGILSVLAGITMSGDVKIIGRFLFTIFQCVSTITDGIHSNSKMITSSALSRKLLIKILRAIAISSLQHESVGNTLPDCVEISIGFLLDSLADTDTLVRFASSKALGMISSKMDPDMAGDVIDAISGGLEEDLYWVDPQTSKSCPSHSQAIPMHGKLEPNTASVNALRWHGLALSLAQILFRHSVPASQLPIVLNALLLALDFEQRKSTGTSIGGNVRDAACFGIWSIARKFTTRQILDIETSEIRAANLIENSTSMIQVLANRMMVSATLDPSGNIRRGASAALQELIGRHPDTVSQGISIVQTVDYHSVALRSNAMSVVTRAAANLDKQYCRSITSDLLGWKGVASPDAMSRRLAAHSLGMLVTIYSDEYLSTNIKTIARSLKSTPTQKVEKRHGLLLALSSIIRQIAGNSSLTENAPNDLIVETLGLLRDHVSDRDLTTKSLKPYLIAEAACEVIQALCLYTEAAKSNGKPHTQIPSDNVLRVHRQCLQRSEESATEALCRSVHAYFLTIDLAERSLIALEWIKNLTKAQVSRMRSTSNPITVIAVLGSIFQLLGNLPAEAISDTQRELVVTLATRVSRTSTIEIRVRALRSLNEGSLRCGICDPSVIEALKEALQDYTVDSRGDIGSLVRIEGLHAVSALFDKFGKGLEEQIRRNLVSLVAGLAMEKLDRVRLQAALVLRDCGLLDPRNSDLDTREISTTTYFRSLLYFVETNPYTRRDMIIGLMTTISSGSDISLIAARKALTDYLGHATIISKADTIRVVISIAQQSLVKKDERVLIPALESLAFLLDTRALDHFLTLQIPRNNANSELLNLLRRSRLKTSNVKRLSATIRCLAGLAALPDPCREVEHLQIEASKNLREMLSHDFPGIREEAAEALCRITDPLMNRMDGQDITSQGPSKLRQTLESTDWKQKISSADMQELLKAQNNVHHPRSTNGTS